ncbi:MAG TPA: RNA polymerase sigma factor [Labilithrix sp.]
MSTPSFPVPQRRTESRVRDAVEANYEALYRFVRRLGVESADVEDAVQRVLVVFAERIASVTRGSERSFLFGTAVRVASDVRKKRARSREVSADGVLDMHVDPLPDAAARIDDERLRAWLDVVLDGLPEENRTVLVLVDIEEQTMAEAATMLGLPPGTVASRLRRGRELFERGANELRAKLEGGTR